MRTGFTAAALPFPPVRPGRRDWSGRKIGAQQFAQQLEQLAGQDAVLWNAQQLGFAEAESRLYHGGMYRLWQDGCPAGVCNLYRYTADKVIVKELLTKLEVCAEQLVKQICGSFEGGLIEFRLHPQLDLGQRVPAGMLRFTHRSALWQADRHICRLFWIEQWNREKSKKGVGNRW